MAFNGSGVFVRPYNWTNDAANTIPIRADRMDAAFDGIATALSKCVLKDGQQTITDHIPYNGKRIYDLGDATAATDALNRQSGDARFLQISNNLSDVTAATARTNLELGSLAVLDTVDTAQMDDNSVTTQIINNQAVTLAKQAPSTAGDILYYNGSGFLTALSKGDDGQVLSLASGIPEWIDLPSGVPTGSIHQWMTSTPPDGYLACDGSAVSRTTYSGLFGVLSDDYGIGDGSTTFNLPDFRGYTIRGWDNGAGVDPDAASRTDRGDGTTGDNVGTKQVDMFEIHRHVGGVGASTASGATTHYGFVNVGNSALIGTDGFGTYGAYTSNIGGNETRMKNINVMFIIKT